MMVLLGRWWLVRVWLACRRAMRACWVCKSLARLAIVGVVADRSFAAFEDVTSLAEVLGLLMEILRLLVAWVAAFADG